MIKIAQDLFSYLKKYKIYPKNVLQLDCKSWDVLSCFEQSKVYGLCPNDDVVLEKLKLEFSGWKFYHQNATSFRLPYKMQLIFMLDEYLNSWSKFSQWELIFNKIYDHLEPYGLFVFDVFLPKYYQSVWCIETKFSIVDGDYSFTKSFEKRWVFYQETKKFINQKDNLFLLDENITKKAAFPLADIKKSLQEKFESISVIWIVPKKLSVSSHKVRVICQKWW